MHDMDFSYDADGDPQFICPECGYHVIFHGEELTVPTEGERVPHRGTSNPKIQVTGARLEA